VIKYVLLKIHLPQITLGLFRKTHKSCHTFFKLWNTFCPFEELSCSQLEHNTQGLQRRNILVSSNPPQDEFSPPQLPNAYIHYAFHVATPPLRLNMSIVTSSSPNKIRPLETHTSPP